MLTHDGLLIHSSWWARLLLLRLLQQHLSFSFPLYLMPPRRHLAISIVAVVSWDEHPYMSSPMRGGAHVAVAPLLCASTRVMCRVGICSAVPMSGANTI